MIQFPCDVVFLEIRCKRNRQVSSWATFRRSGSEMIWVFTDTGHGGHWEGPSGGLCGGACLLVVIATPGVVWKMKG